MWAVFFLVQLTSRVLCLHTFFLISFPICFLSLSFFAIPWLLMARQHCVEWIPIREKIVSSCSCAMEFSAYRMFFLVFQSTLVEYGVSRHLYFWTLFTQLHCVFFFLVFFFFCYSLLCEDWWSIDKTFVVIT